MLILEAEKRDMKAKPGNLRKQGVLPAVYYGKKEASTPISIPTSQFKKVWKEAGESTVVVLKGVDGDLEALIHDVDVDPITGNPRHVDFYVFEKGKKIEVSVPIEFTGVSPAVKELGGVLVKVLHEITVEALPKDLPHELKVDISALVDFESLIAAKDVTLPSGVDLVENPEEIVASISEPKEEEEEPAEPVDFSAIEVEKKGKEEESAEEGSEDQAKKEKE